MILALLLACRPDPQPAVVAGARLVPLDDARLVRRLSLDLRGTLPTIAELDAVEADPAALEAVRDAMLDDPLLEERLVSLLAERYQTRVDEFEVLHEDYHLDDSRAFEYVKSIGEEPLRLMARIAVEDRPWTETVTADWTMASPVMGEIWQVDYPDGATGWQVARYTDGRPPAGVLATNGLWWRYVTNVSNLSRSRAAAVSNLLLCEDYLDRPITFSRTTSLADEEGTAEMIRSEPACVGCHVSLDPLAASMFGFYTMIGYNPDELGAYHPERETLGADLLDVTPAYFGTPLGGLADLGRQIAADPRFVRCATQNMAQLLWRRAATVEDYARIEDLRDTFVEEELRMRPLLRAITDEEVYRAGGLGPGATEADAEEMTIRMLSADQLASSVEELTGFRWTYQGYDLLQDDSIGYRVMVGGVSGSTVSRPQQDPGLTWSLVAQRVAEGGAAYAVQAELTDGGERRAFQHVTLSSRPGDDDFRAELETLHRRLYATRPTEARLAAYEQLWTDLGGADDPAEAWKGLLSALIRDPEMLAY